MSTVQTHHETEHASHPLQLQPLPDGLWTLDDHRKHAHKTLDGNAWAYCSGGAADEITLQANRDAWDRMALKPRVLQSLRGGNTRVTLLGRVWPLPILVAPMAYQRLAHPDGELACAVAAAAQGVGMVLSTQASVRLETVASAVASESTRGPLWFQLYLQPDWEQTRTLVRRAETAGFEALVVTVDAPCSGYRDRERRANFKLPPGISAVNLVPAIAHPSSTAGASTSFPFLGGLGEQAPTWNDLATLQDMTRLPIVLKGILHEADAAQAADMGFSGVIVSNHGGRTLDTAVATAVALPRVVDAVQGKVPVLVDGGIGRGTDIVKALALGASAVLVGRPCLYGLANAGALGVAHVLRLLRDELEIAMALSGCATLDKLQRDLVDPAPLPAGVRLITQTPA